MDALIGFVYDLLSAAGVVAALVVIAGALSKLLIKQLLKKDIDKHKNTLDEELEAHKANLSRANSEALHALQTKSSVQLERLRSALQNEGFREQHRFSEMYGRTLRAVQGLNRRRRHLTKAIANVTSGVVEKNSVEFDRAELENAWESFSDYFADVEILLEPEVVRATRELHDRVGTLVQQFLLSSESYEEEYKSREFSAASRYREQMLQNIQSIKDEMPGLRESFLKAVRASLGRKTP
jgi:hypothetical protein